MENKKPKDEGEAKRRGKELQVLLDNFAERNRKLNEFSNGVRRGFDLFIKASNEMREIDKKQSHEYFTWYLETAAACESKVEALSFLRESKDKCEDKITRAKIERDGISERFYEKVIIQYINPLIERYKDFIAFEKEYGIIVGKKNGQLGVIEATKEKAELIRIEEEKEPVVQNESDRLPLPEGFKKIKCYASKEQIIAYFSILSQELNPSNNKPYMCQNDVDELVRNNFVVFKDNPTGKIFELNLSKRQKGVLRYFVYQFFLKYEMDQISNKMKYVHFLIWNFTLFNDDNPANLNKNMNSSNKPSPDKIIDINKYLK